MQGQEEVAVLRVGHRPARDDRMTTHVGLTARALGADRVILPADASDACETVRTVADRFGGPFEAETTRAWRPVIREWPGVVVHLTMYGLPIQTVQADLREAHRMDPLLIVVGAEKVPFEVYDRADWNVAVTNQPHSEVAGLAVLLDRLFDGAELDREWVDADQTVVPRATGKRVDPVDGDSADDTPEGPETAGER